MKVFISGSCELALIENENGTFDVVSLERPRQQAHMDHIQRVYHATDTFIATCNSVEEIHQKLQIEVDKIDSLQLSLIILDPELFSTTRKLACEELEPLLQNSENLIFIKEIFISIPPNPLHHDGKGALEFSQEFPLVHKFFLEIIPNP